MLLMYICYFSIDASASCRLGRFVNDSPRRYANCAPKAMYIAGQPRLLLFAIRNIQYGTELRFDYGVAKLPWRKVGLLLNCNCTLHDSHTSFNMRRSKVMVTRPINAETENVQYLSYGKSYELQSWCSDGT